MLVSVLSGVLSCSAGFLQDASRLLDHKRDVVRLLASPIALERAEVFSRQIADWIAEQRPGVPTVASPGIDVHELGRCISCGERLPSGRTWRCHDCLVAFTIALDDDLDPGDRR
jgi:hypothetical protein